MSIKTAQILSSGAFMGAVLWSAAANGQVAVDADPPAEQTSGIADIVVTAQRRAESMQNVPIAISSFNGQMLEHANITSLQDLQGRTPGLVINSFSPGQPELAIRGIGTKEDGAGASDSTLVMVDGVYFAARTATNIDIFDLEQVEVLRGPQGTLFGKNAIAGVINYVTKKPTLGEFELKVRQTVGNFGTFDTGAGVNVPIGDTLAARLSFSRRKTDGYLTRVNVGVPAIPFGTEDSDHIGYVNRFAWRAAVKWEPSDATTLLISLDGANDDFGTDNREPVGSAGPLHNCLCASNPVAVNVAIGGASGKHGGVYSYAGEILGYSKREIFGGMAQLDHDFGFATLTVLGAYRDSTYKNVLDSSGLPPSPVIDLTGAHGSPNIGLTAAPTVGFTFDTTDIVEEKGKQATGEVRLTSPSGQRLKWVAGIFASHEDIDRVEAVGFPALSDASLKPSLAAANMFFTGNSIAGYGQASFDITDTLTITGGARYSYEKKEIGARNDILASATLILLYTAFPLTRGEDSWKNFSWKINAQYRPSKDIMVYANVSTGFKSGGFTGAATTATVATKAFNPEKATNYEVGAKLDLFDRRLRLNTSTFYIDYSDLQVTRFFQPVGSNFGEFITENAATAEIKGVEVELTARPVEWLEVGGTYAYLDAKYKSFFGTPDISGTGDFSGNRLRQAPKNVWSAYVQLSHELSWGDVLTANVSGRHQDKSFTNADNNPLDVIPAYTLGDAWVSWRSANKKWELQAWVKNFTDEAWRSHVYTQRGDRIAFGTFGAPRQYGLTLTFDY